jgi:hypothetical protein
MSIKLDSQKYTKQAPYKLMAGLFIKNGLNFINSSGQYQILNLSMQTYYQVLPP